MQFILNKDVEFILSELNNNGAGFLVGGALRDMLLNSDPGDYDFATNIEYDKLKKIFSKYNPREVGAHFGILIITVNGKEYEIAKFRKEIGIYNSRYPKKIKFINTIEEDLKRRDFTINALAYNKEFGFIDLYNGKEDLENKIIKFVGNPKLRIEEDSLRIMRAFRFISKLGFELDKKTAEAIYEKRKFLNKISKERIFDEFSKILLGPYMKKSLYEMKKLGVLEIIIPEIKYIYNFEQKNLHKEKVYKDNLFKHTIKTIENCDKDLITRLSALFHDLGKTNTKTIDAKGNISYDGHEKEGALLANEKLKYLKASNEIIESVSSLVLYHNLAYKEVSDKTLKKIILELGNKNLNRLFDLTLADLNSKYVKEYKIANEKVQNLLERMEKLLKNNKIPTLKDLNITGVDLINLKFESKNIGKIKEEIYDEILDDKLENEKEKIVEYLIKRYDIKTKFKKEKSCGAVIYNEKKMKYLLVKMHNGNWGFPKGHVEKNESEIETAIREIKEETGINIEIKEKFRESIKYIPSEQVIKEVVFFLTKIKSELVNIDKNEIEDFLWCSYEEAMKMITYKVQRDVLEKANIYIENENKKLSDIGWYI